MQALSATSSIVAQVGALCEVHPTRRKVVFVSHVQLGQALEVAAARYGKGWAGLSCFTPRHYAERMAQWDMLTSERRKLPPAGMRFLASHLVEGLDSSMLKELPASSHFARTVARAIQTLRAGGITPGSVRKRAADSNAALTFRVIAACYESYHAFLDENALYDDADVLRWATQRVRATAPQEVEKTVYAACDGTELPEQAYQWLRALQEHGAGFYRIGEPASEKAPPHTAAALFSEAPLPPSGKKSAEPSIPRVRRAIGAENEVRGVLQEILAEGIPLDEVEIAYAASQPYLPLVADLTEQIDVAVTLGTGLPALQTRSGQALSGFYEWIQEDFDVKLLIRLLRSGLVRIDRVLAGRDTAAEADLAAHEVATLLAGQRYETGREGCKKAFEVMRSDMEATVQRLEERGLHTEKERSQLQDIQLVQFLVGELLDLAPRHCSIQKMAQASQHFLERFGPIDKPEEEQEAERTMEEAARSVLYQKLGRLAQLPFQLEASCSKLAGMLQEAIGEQYVRLSRPRAGAAHVVPLESAGYTGRPYLFVVGMDSEALSWPALDDVMLRDADRAVLGAELEGHLQDCQGAADEALWRVERALRRHRGTLTLYTSVFDVTSNEERFPAALFLEVEQASEEVTPIAGFLPEKDGALHVDDRASWLEAYAASKRMDVPSDRTARDALEAEFSWILAGEEAQQGCCAETYTCHDGMLEEGPYAALDFTRSGYDGPPMSAGRLETLAETPYLYFLQYVLGVEPLDEPALDEAAWLNPLRRGNLLHRTFERFMSELDGEPVSPDHEGQLLEALGEVLEEEKRHIAPPNERVEAAARRALQDDALIFLYAEVDVAGTIQPLHHELGFGYRSRYQQDGDHGPVSLALKDQVRLPLRGRIDRVDRMNDGALALWDYKTGSAKAYSQDDPLNGGAHLQWALYAYVLGELTGETIRRSGYLFANTKEMGARLHADPGSYREEVERMIARLGQMARHGCFPMTPRARYLNGWTRRGYERLFPDMAERSRQLKAKKENYPENHPQPLFYE